MSEQLHEQVSAFVDGELPEHETELLLRRLERDRDLQRAYARYITIGAAMRGEPIGNRSSTLVERVRVAVAQESAQAGKVSRPLLARSGRWLRPLAGAAVAAAVATVAILGVQRIQLTDPATDDTTGTAQVASAAYPAPAPAIGSTDSAEPPSYVVPPFNPERRAVPAGARLTNYVLAHSEYSSLGRRNVLSGVIAEDPVAIEERATEEPESPPADRQTDSDSSPAQQP
jgi:negative regulator of sigma E activity